MASSSNVHMSMAYCPIYSAKPINTPGHRSVALILHVIDQHPTPTDQIVLSSTGERCYYFQNPKEASDYIGMILASVMPDLSDDKLSEPTSSLQSFIQRIAEELQFETSETLVELEFEVLLESMRRQIEDEGARETVTPKEETHGSDSSKDEACAVCQEELFSTNKKIKAKKTTRIPCSHTFHFKCIKEWLEKEPTCPICRSYCMADWIGL